ncbi:MAG TPA: alpha/beta hydrolase [Actinocatenispora sp.]
MLTVEQLREVRPERVAAMAESLRGHAQRIAAVVEQAVESAGRDLAGWQGPAATASTAHRHALADDAHRLGDAHSQASAVISGLADRLDQARQLLDLADNFAHLVGCQVYGRAEVTVLPPTMLGPLAGVYDSVRRTAASLAAQALVVAEAADTHASHALGGRPTAADTDAGTGAGSADGAQSGDGSGQTALAGAGAGPEAADTDQEQADADGLGALVDEHQSVGDLALAVSIFYGALPAGRRAGPRRKKPKLVAHLPGAPLPERYAANRQLIDESRAELRRSRTELAAAQTDERTVTRARTMDAINQRIGTLNSFLASRTVAAVDPGTGERTSGQHERRFLAFDPSGAGRAAEVFGDPTTATHVAVLVPGGRNGLDTFNSLANDARLLADTAGPDTAVIAWLGYDAGGAGTGPAQARAGASALRRFLAGLAPTLRPTTRVVVVGHGFGTVLVAAALRAGYQPDDVVFVGSAGLGERIRSVADLRPARPDTLPGPVLTADPGTRLWAMRAPGDAVAYSRAYGADPADFADVTRLETQGGTEVTGHGRYYAVGSESLDNLARVASGRLTEVSVTDTTLDEELMLAGLDQPGAVAPPAPAPTPVAALDGVLDTVGTVGGTLVPRPPTHATGTGT